MKRCGCKEQCFENDPALGHVGGIICKHNNENTCGKDGSHVDVYTTEKQYQEKKDANS